MDSSQELLVRHRRLNHFHLDSLRPRRLINLSDWTGQVNDEHLGICCVFAPSVATSLIFSVQKNKTCFRW